MKTKDSELKGAESAADNFRGNFPDLEQVPLFSRNLEVSVKRPGSDNGLGKPGTPELVDEDRMIYFQVESGKIVDIIERDIAMLERNRFSSNLVSDMYESWLTLWGDDDAFPVGRFTELFEIVCRVLNSMVEIEHKPDLDEQSVIEKVVGAMRGLANGNTDLTALDSMGRYIDNLKKISDNFESKSSSRSLVENNLEEKEEIVDDITSSVDKWFKQASGYASETEKKNPLPEPEQVNRIEFRVNDEQPVSETSKENQTENIHGGSDSLQEESSKETPQSDQDNEPEDYMETDIVPDIVTAYLREKTDETAKLLEYNSELITSDKPSRIARFVIRQFNELRDLTMFMSIPETLELMEEARIVLSDTVDNGKVASRSALNGSGGVDKAVYKLEELGSRLGRISVESLL